MNQERRERIKVVMDMIVVKREERGMDKKRRVKRERIMIG